MKPVLFLDFDRTLFDTDQLYVWLGEDRFSRILALTGGHILPPDFASYLYPDSIEFLTRMRQTYRIVILTYALNTILQRKKIRGSGILPYCDDVLIVAGGEGILSGKGEAARAYLKRVGDSGWEHTFVDDLPENIDEVKRINPHIRCVRIDRVPSKDGVHTEHLKPDMVATSLSELASLL